MELDLSDLFVNEDLSKQENRINLAMFHLQMYKPFHRWLMNKLGVPENTLLYPTKNTKGDRPDYVLKNKNNIIGYIEVECGTNEMQVKKFRDKLENNQVKIYTIFGLKKYNSDVSLEEIKEYLQEQKRSITDSQIKISIEYLIQLIINTIYSINDTSRKEVNTEFIENTPFLKELLDKIKLAKIDKETDINKPIPGHVYYDTVKENGFSLQVYSSHGTKKHISLLSISGGRLKIIFQSAKKYRYYLDHKSRDDVEKWIDFVCSMGYDITRIAEKGRISIPIKRVMDNMDKLLERIKSLV